MWTKLRQLLWQCRGVLIAAPGVTELLIRLRLAGLLQGLELAALDQFFRLRPKEPVDSRIAIVGINEEDIRKAGQWSMSDATLAKLLEILKQKKPRAIGLDLYRDLPVEPGHQKLVNVFTSTPTLIGIQKVVGNGAGVEIHAHLVSQILSAALEGRPQIKVWSEPLEALWIFGWSAFGATAIWIQRYRGGVNQRSLLKTVSIGILRLGRE